MLLRMLRADLRRGVAQSVALTVLASLAVALVAMSAALGIRAGFAVNSLWKEAKPPDVVHMYTGTPNAHAVAQWAGGRSDVKDYHLMRSLPVPVRQLKIAGKSQADSVLEPAFVTAPERFDFLLGQDGKPARPGPGEIALPVHYKAEGVAKVGDVVRVQSGSWSRELKVVDFVRDPQMNPSMVTSKRLVIHSSDFAEFDRRLEPEYLMEFRLAPGTDASSFLSDFEASGFSSKGITIDTSILKLMNGVTTVPIAAVALLVAILLVIVASLILRYTFLAAMEEDLPQISVLKAVGAPPRGIKRLYLVKYLALTGLGTAVGYLLSFPLAAPLDEAVLLYLGEPAAGAWDVVVPFAAATALGLAMIGFCLLLLRRIDKLSTVQALRTGVSGKIRPRRHHLKLASFKRAPVWLWMGVREAFRPAYALLFGVLSVCTIVMILPVCVVTTMEAPGFATYLGIGSADVRMDVKKIDSSQGDAAGLAETFARVKAAPGVSRAVKMTTHRYDMTAAGGKKSVVLVESGDHTAFPVNYMRGKAPVAPNDIALSANQAKEAGADVGDTVTLAVPQGGAGEGASSRTQAGDGASEGQAGGGASEGQVSDGTSEGKAGGASPERQTGSGGPSATVPVQSADARKLRVTGVYQDITNGGKTAKTSAETVVGDASQPAQQVIYADLKASADPAGTVADLRAKLPGVTVVQIQDYISQTLGATISQMRTVSVFAGVVSAALAFLVSALFAVLVVKRETPQIAAQLAIGASRRGLRGQYLIRFGTVLLMGIAAGALAVFTLGEAAVGAVLGMLGAPSLSLVANPWLTWIALPGVLALTVAGAVLLALRRIRTAEISDAE